MDKKNRHTKLNSQENKKKDREETQRDKHISNFNDQN